MNLEFLTIKWFSLVHDLGIKVQIFFCVVKIMLGINNTWTWSKMFDVNAKTISSRFTSLSSLFQNKVIDIQISRPLFVCGNENCKYNIRWIALDGIIFIRDIFHPFYGNALMNINFKNDEVPWWSTKTIIFWIKLHTISYNTIQYLIYYQSEEHSINSQTTLKLK